MKEKNNGCGRFTFNNIIPLFAMLILISSSFISMQAQSKAEIFDSAMDAYGNRDYGEAHRLFEQLTKHDFFERELFSSVFVWDTESLMNLGLYDAVISGYEYYINRFTYAGYRPKILYTLGTVYFQLGEYTKSRNRFLQLIEEFPYNEYYYNAQYWIGETFLRQENYERALEYLKGAGMNLVENQYYDYTIFSTAHTYENLGDYHSAVENYEKILNMGSRTKLTGAAQYRIGICYFYLGEYEHSILELTSPDMKNLTPEKKAEALYLLANSYYRTGEFDAAATTYESIYRKTEIPK
jgi:TolA-binding protein